MTEGTEKESNSVRERDFKITRWLMSAAVISSLVRCGEWNRMHEKKDKTPQKCSDEEHLTLDTCKEKFTKIEI